MKIFTVWAVAAMWFDTSCTSYKTVPYMINSAEVCFMFKAYGPHV